MMDTLLPFLPGFAAAYAILLVGASSPGPAVAMLLGISTGQGRRAALIACLGIAAGSACINVLTLLGVGTLLSQAAWAMMGLKVLGSAYLTWLAYGAFKKVLNPPDIHVTESAPYGAAEMFNKGLMLQITNPKAIAFWLAIAALGATQGAGLGVIAVYFITMAAISLACHAAWALALSTEPVRTTFARMRHWVEGALGTFFAFAAFKIATSRI